MKVIVLQIMFNLEDKTEVWLTEQLKFTREQCLLCKVFAVA